MNKRKHVGGRPRTSGLSHNKKAKTYRSGLPVVADENSQKITTFFKSSSLAPVAEQSTSGKFSITV